MDPSEVELKAKDEFRCIFQITLPTKLSSCDIRVSHFNSRKSREGAAEVDEERERLSILHVSFHSFVSRLLMVNESIYFMCSFF